MTRVVEAWSTLRARLDTAFWLIPAVIVATAGIIALVLVRVDRAASDSGAVAFTGGPDSARSLLSTIATSMLTLTGLVFSITIVVLQLTSSQFSPRVLRTFLRDRITQYTLGTFLAAFAYAVLLLREVRGQESEVDVFVPGLAITFAFVLVGLGLVLFVQYIHHIAQSIRVVNILSRIASEAEKAIRDRYPALDSGTARAPTVPPMPGPTQTVNTRRSGVIISVEPDALTGAASDAGAVVALRHRVGDFVPIGAPLADIFCAELDERAVHGAVVTGSERTMHADPLFGVRQVVDIAERALSPGVNDPSTAVQAVDQLHHLLRVLATRDTDVGRHTDRDGQVRLIVPEPAWIDYFELATAEILHWGRSSIQLNLRMGAMLDDLATVVQGDDLSAVLAARAAVQDPAETGIRAERRRRVQTDG